MIFRASVSAQVNPALWGCRARKCSKRPGASQVFSQDIVDEAALFRRDGFAFAKVVLWVFFLLCCEVVCKEILGHFSETILIVGVLCSSAVCSKTIKTTASNPYAPIDKAALSTSSFFIEVQNIPDFQISRSRRNYLQLLV